MPENSSVELHRVPFMPPPPPEYRAIPVVPKLGAGAGPNQKPSSFFLTNRAGQIISPWHDIPLLSHAGNLNVVCTIPQGCRTAFRLLPDHRIGFRLGRNKQPVQLSAASPWNYGIIPQSGPALDLECDPEELEDLFEHLSPMEVVDISFRTRSVGDVYELQPLFAFVVVDSRAVFMESKVIVGIDVSDPLSLRLRDDMSMKQKIPPITVQSLQAWLQHGRVLENSQGSRGRKVFGLDMGGKLATAMKTVVEAHAAWKEFYPAYQKHLDSGHGPPLPRQQGNNSPFPRQRAEWSASPSQQQKTVPGLASIAANGEDGERAKKEEGEKERVKWEVEGEGEGVYEKSNSFKNYLRKKSGKDKAREGGSERPKNDSGAPESSSSVQKLGSITSPTAKPAALSLSRSKSSIPATVAVESEPCARPTERSDRTERSTVDRIFHVFSNDATSLFRSRSSKVRSETRRTEKVRGREKERGERESETEKAREGEREGVEMDEGRGRKRETGREQGRQRNPEREREKRMVLEGATSRVDEGATYSTETQRRPLDREGSSSFSSSSSPSPWSISPTAVDRRWSEEIPKQGERDTDRESELAREAPKRYPGHRPNEARESLVPRSWSNSRVEAKSSFSAEKSKTYQSAATNTPAGLSAGPSLRSRDNEVRLLNVCIGHGQAFSDDYDAPERAAGQGTAGERATVEGKRIKGKLFPLMLVPSPSLSPSLSCSSSSSGQPSHLASEAPKSVERKNSFEDANRSVSQGRNEEELGASDATPGGQSASVGSTLRNVSNTSGEIADNDEPLPAPPGSFSKPRLSVPPVRPSSAAPRLSVSSSSPASPASSHSSSPQLRTWDKTASASTSKGAFGGGPLYPISQKGSVGKESHRMFLLGTSGAPLSPLNDVSLFSPSGGLSFVCLMPRGSRSVVEVDPSGAIRSRFYALKYKSIKEGRAEEDVGAEAGGEGSGTTWMCTTQGSKLPELFCEPAYFNCGLLPQTAQLGFARGACESVPCLHEQPPPASQFQGGAGHVDPDQAADSSIGNRGSGSERQVVPVAMEAIDVSVSTPRYVGDVYDVQVLFCLRVVDPNAMSFESRGSRMVAVVIASNDPMFVQKYKGEASKMVPNLPPSVFKHLGDWLVVGSRLKHETSRPNRGVPDLNERRTARSHADALRAIADAHAHWQLHFSKQSRQLAFCESPFSPESDSSSSHASSASLSTFSATSLSASLSPLLPLSSSLDSQETTAIHFSSEEIPGLGAGPQRPFERGVRAILKTFSWKERRGREERSPKLSELRQLSNAPSSSWLNAHSPSLYSPTTSPAELSPSSCEPDPGWGNSDSGKSGSGIGDSRTSAKLKSSGSSSPPHIMEQDGKFVRSATEKWKREIRVDAGSKGFGSFDKIEGRIEPNRESPNRTADHAETASWEAEVRLREGGGGKREGGDEREDEGDFRYAVQKEEVRWLGLSPSPFLTDRPPLPPSTLSPTHPQPPGSSQTPAAHSVVQHASRAPPIGRVDAGALPPRSPTICLGPELSDDSLDSTSEGDPNPSRVRNPGRSGDAARPSLNAPPERVRPGVMDLPKLSIWADGMLPSADLYRSSESEGEREGGGSERGIFEEERGNEGEEVEGQKSFDFLVSPSLGMQCNPFYESRQRGAASRAARKATRGIEGETPNFVRPTTHFSAFEDGEFSDSSDASSVSANRGVRALVSVRGKAPPSIWKEEGSGGFEDERRGVSRAKAQETSRSRLDPTAPSQVKFVVPRSGPTVTKSQSLMRRADPPAGQPRGLKKQLSVLTRTTSFSADRASDGSGGPDDDKGANREYLMPMAKLQPCSFSPSLSEEKSAEKSSLDGRVSLWHAISLRASVSSAHFVCTRPRGSRTGACSVYAACRATSTDELATLPMEVHESIVNWNCGFLPQTVTRRHRASAGPEGEDLAGPDPRDRFLLHPAAPCWSGLEPVEAFEISGVALPAGGIAHVRPLFAMAVIDPESSLLETKKVVCIAQNDPLSAEITNLESLRRCVPNEKLQQIRTWLKGEDVHHRVSGRKSRSVFGLSALEPKGIQRVLRVILDAHSEWTRVVEMDPFLQGKIVPLSQAETGGSGGERGKGGAGERRETGGGKGTREKPPPKEREKTPLPTVAKGLPGSDADRGSEPEERGEKKILAEKGERKSLAEKGERKSLVEKGERKNVGEKVERKGERRGEGKGEKEGFAGESKAGPGATLSEKKSALLALLNSKPPGLAGAAKERAREEEREVDSPRERERTKVIEVAPSSREGGGGAVKWERNTQLPLPLLSPSHSSPLSSSPRASSLNMRQKKPYLVIDTTLEQGRCERERGRKGGGEGEPSGGRTDEEYLRDFNPANATTLTLSGSASETSPSGNSDLIEGLITSSAFRRDAPNRFWECSGSNGAPLLKNPSNSGSNNFRAPVGVSKTAWEKETAAVSAQQPRNGDSGSSRFQTENSSECQFRTAFEDGTSHFKALRTYAVKLRDSKADIRGAEVRTERVGGLRGSYPSLSSAASSKFLTSVEDREMLDEDILPHSAARRTAPLRGFEGPGGAGSPRVNSPRVRAPGEDAEARLWPPGPSTLSASAPRAELGLARAAAGPADSTLRKKKVVRHERTGSRDMQRWNVSPKRRNMAVQGIDVDDGEGTRTSSTRGRFGR